MVTITSTNNSSFNQLQSFNSDNKDNHPRDASFSSYLNSNEEIFGRKLSDPSRNFNSFISKGGYHLCSGGKKEEDGEIGVFEAEKYFNGEMEQGSPVVANVTPRKHLNQKDEPIDEQTRCYGIKSATPSVRSESSWNSRSELVQSALRNSSRDKKNKAQGKSFLAGLVCKCSCSDKSSVDISDADENNFNTDASYGVVHDKTASKKAFNPTLDPNHSAIINKVQAESWTNKDAYIKNPGNLGVGLSIENGLAFQSVNSGLAPQLVKMQLQKKEEKKPRKLLEVFGSPALEKRSMSLSFDKRLTIPSWETAPKVEDIEFSEIPGGNYDDAASDASSDLFEIDSLTGKFNPFLARQNSDVASGCVTPTTAYAPSEDSIEWSVVTASVAECSVMSDFEEQRSVAIIRSPPRSALTSSNEKIKANREMHRRLPSILSGCKSHEAVRVAGNAFMTYEKPSSVPQTRRRSDSFLQATRFQEETKLGNLGGQRAYATQPMQLSHSPHASQFLYI
ncbi:hypothetical protein L6164_027100 [Bauhinia variegata]|uniref:Uncharacterized protein n=1 Tax=Bauhinia variegata TaxID=167791 RepID=A0ACB9LTM0_BAUVA|nr:hypothetical protein L6164_027100 [Bauhinia variegata]